MKKKNGWIRVIASTLAALIVVFNLPLSGLAAEDTAPVLDLVGEEVVDSVTGTDEAADETTNEVTDEQANETTDSETLVETKEPEVSTQPEADGEEVQTDAALAEENTAENLPEEEQAEPTVESEEEPLPDGTEEHPFQISTVEDLVELATSVNRETDPLTYEGQFFVLTRDIDLADYLAGEGNNGGKGWTPIGGTSEFIYGQKVNANRWFSGTFDGQGNTISGLWMNYEKGNEFSVGLFGATQDSVIRNLNVEIGEDGIIGYGSTGGLIGTQIVTEGTSATVENCSVTGEAVRANKKTGRVSAAGGLIGYVEMSGDFTIQGCSTTVEAESQWYAGGLVAYLTNMRDKEFVEGITLTIEDSSATGDVAGQTYGGGLIGDFRLDGEGTTTQIANCFATGGVTTKYGGGLIGSSGGQQGPSITVENCYATGNVTGLGSSGGLIGVFGGGGNNTIQTCYATGDVKGSDTVGGLVGNLGGANIQGTYAVRDSYAEGNVTGNNDVGGFIGLVQVWNKLEETTGTCIIEESYATGDVTGDGENSYSIGGFIGGVYSANADVTVDNCSATGSVTGQFDSGGLVGALSGENVQGTYTVQNSFATGSVTGKQNIGGLVGWVNFYAEPKDGNVASMIESCYATGEITGTNAVGGLVGNLSGENIQGTYTVRNSYAAGSVTGEKHIGGLVGRLYFENESEDNVTSTIESCYATGEIKGNNFVGGLVGSYLGKNIAANYTLQNCYVTGNITGEKNSGGLMGYLQIKNEPEGTAGICMVDACYVTGAITGDGSIGGLIGGTSNSNAEVTVKNNLSLITAIDGSSAVGRIFGNRSSEATLSDNYAYRSMKVNGDLISTGDENYGATKFHGANVTAKQLQDFATAENAALNKFATDDTWNYTPGELPVLENVANKAEQDRDLPFRYVEYFKKENGVFTALEEDEDWTAGTQYSVKTGEDLGVELYEEEGKTYWYDRLGGQMVLAPDALSDAEFKNHELYARIGSGEIEQYTLSFEVDGGTDIESITADKDTEFDLADYQTDKDGHTFAGWHTDADHAEEFKTITLTQDTTVYAKWNKTEDGGGSGGGSTKRYTLTFAVNGGNTLPSVRKSSGTKLDLANYKTAKEGYTFLGWYADADLTEEVKTVVLRKDTTVYAKWTDDGTELREHKAYLFGFGDGTVRPDAAISRAEVAQILYRISGEKDTHMASYSDVKSGAWYYDAVSSMTDQGIITGYPDGSFRPDSAISRAEFSTLIAKYNELDISEMATFPDVSASHWASRFIAAAQENGYVYGYSDGTFRPENSITRGEVASIINKMLGMVCDADSFANVQSDLKMFTDNRDTSKWHYYEMITATNSCTYRLDGKRHPVWVSVK